MRISGRAEKEGEKTAVAVDVLLEFEESAKSLPTKNYYTEVVSDCFDVIHRLLLKGFSRSSIFHKLQSRGIFNDNAEISNFYKVIAQIYQRKNMKIPQPSAYVRQIKRKFEEENR